MYLSSIINSKVSIKIHIYIKKDAEDLPDLQVARVEARIRRQDAHDAIDCRTYKGGWRKKRGIS